MGSSIYSSAIVMWVGAVNTGLRALASDGRGLAFPSTEPHGVWAKLVSPHRGLAQATELRLIKSV